MAETMEPIQAKLRSALQTALEDRKRSYVDDVALRFCTCDSKLRAQTLLNGEASLSDWMTAFDLKRSNLSIRGAKVILRKISEGMSLAQAEAAMEKEQK